MPHTKMRDFSPIQTQKSPPKRAFLPIREDRLILSGG
jgi:hypothetical protein